MLPINSNRKLILKYFTIKKICFNIILISMTMVLTIMTILLRIINSDEINMYTCSQGVSLGTPQISFTRTITFRSFTRTSRHTNIYYQEELSIYHRYIPNYNIHSIKNVSVYHYTPRPLKGALSYQIRSVGAVTIIFNNSKVRLFDMK